MNKSLRIFCASFFMTCGAIHAQVQDTIPSVQDEYDVSLEELMDMKVSVTKREETTRESAMNLRIITRADIENYGFRTLTDVMMFLESGFESNKGQDRVFALRGVMGYANDKIKFLIDGQEFPTMLGLGEGDFPVTLDEVKRIEIAKGPNVSIYGGNASQAIINIVRFDANDYQGLRVGIAYGRWKDNKGFTDPSFHAKADTALDYKDRDKTDPGGGSFHNSFYINYLTQPVKDLSFNVYMAGTYQTGPLTYVHQWWGDVGYMRRFKRDARTPLPDHEIIMSMKYKGFKIMYRKMDSRQTHNGSSYNRNYTNAIAASFSKDELFGVNRLSLGSSLELSHFGNWYDVYHTRNKAINGTIEHKAAQRLETDLYVRYSNSSEESAKIKYDAMVGMSFNTESAIGTEFRDYALTDSSGLYNYLGDSTAENFPSFAEINDIANFEPWTDIKIKPIDKLSINIGGRYVHDFVPGYQLRDATDSIAKFYTKRELLRKFFPKFALVYQVRGNLYVKAIYQEGYNRPGTFEQFSAQNTIPMRGTLKATTAQTVEGVIDWAITRKVKTVFSAYYTKYKDFVNFAYTGPGWPSVDATKGEVRGFVNIGDLEMGGLENTWDADFKNIGGTFTTGYLLKNVITNLEEKFSKLDVGNSGASGITNLGKDSVDRGLYSKNINKQTVPRFNFSTGLWVKPFGMAMRDPNLLTVAVLYSAHIGSIINGGTGDQTFGSADPVKRGLRYRNLNSLDLTFTSKPTEKLFIQLRVKNLVNAQSIRGSALDPSHYETQLPRYVEGKVTYTF